jgi:hypothetical protein
MTASAKTSAIMIAPRLIGDDALASVCGAGIGVFARSLAVLKHLKRLIFKCGLAAHSVL